MPVMGITAEESPSHPISKISRMIDPNLEMVENRLKFLSSLTSTLPKYRQFPLKYGIGYRGCRYNADDPDPTIIMDFGQEYPITTLYLVPAQSEYLNDTGIFPIQFTIDISSDPEFSNPTKIYQSSVRPNQKISGYPMKLNTHQHGRYLRITVHKGHQKGGFIDLFGFSEFFVLSEQEPISFRSTITTSSAVNVDNLWYPEALIDGRTPLGLWHHGQHPPTQNGDAVLALENDDSHVTWQVDLTRDCDIDRIVLHPYQLRQSFETSTLPEALEIQVQQANQNTWETIYQWKHPIPGTTHICPLIATFDKMTANKVRVIATQPSKLIHQPIYALSEIEVWANGENKIKDLPVTRTHGDTQEIITSLTDGFSSEKTIFPIELWLKQLTARGKIESELTQLNDVFMQLSSSSDLNVSWGSAVLLGLTFLIPVYVFEHRRIKSKEYIDVIRKRIASDLHDDIGSNLGSISLIARTARKDLARLQGSAELDNDLGEVEIIARESSLAMRDIVWLLERQQDSIGDLVLRMRETAKRLLREIEYTIECTSSKTTAKISLDAKRHLFLFYKEAIHNTLKHSQASEVSIKLWDEGDKLALQIQDNGNGLHVTKESTPVDVKKLKARAEILGGKLTLDSSAEAGTCIRLLVKRSTLTAKTKKS